MTEIAVQEASRVACQSTAPMPSRSSSQFTRPKSRAKISVKMMLTAATDVTLGMSTPSRKNVRARSRRLRIEASPRASSSCGAVASTNMPRVLRTAFQK